jgi:capsular polysaccharide biosynthesis protein
LDRPEIDWPEGPSLVESVRQYKWLVLAAVLIGAMAVFLWSSQQPARYEGVVRLFLDIGDDQADPSRVVKSQAQYLVSPTVLDTAVERINGRLTRQELEKRLTVEPANDADVITIRTLGATPQEAATLANTIVTSYREVVAKQADEAARQAIANLTRRQRQLEAEITEITEQLRTRSGDPGLEAARDAKRRQLNDLADQIENIRRDSASTGRTAERVQEKAAIPQEPAQPKPLRSAAIGALLALVAAAGLAWWLYGRQLSLERQWSSPRALEGGGRERATGLDLSSPSRLASRFRNGHAASTNGSPAGNGTVSGIADFDEIATSVQQLFRFLDGPSQRLYEEDLPQMAVEEIAHRFRIDMAAILLDNAGEVQTMGSVGLRAARTGTIDSGLRHLIEAAAKSGPRLVDHDELLRLSSMGLGADQVDSLALVPLVRDQVGFGVLLAGRHHADEAVTPLSDREAKDIADHTRDIVPYVWAWLLLRNLKLRLRTLQ